MMQEETEAAAQEVEGSGDAGEKAAEGREVVEVLVDSEVGAAAARVAVSTTRRQTQQPVPGMPHIKSQSVSW